MTATLDPRTPIVIGVGVAHQRSANIDDSLETIALIELAARRAAADTGVFDVAALLRSTDLISIPKGIWSYTDPGRMVASRIHAGSARSALFELGVLQTSIFRHGFEAILNGDADVVIIAGGEAKYRALQAAIAGIAAPESSSPTDPPDIVVTPDHDIVHEIEVQRGLRVPARQYAIIDSALRYAKRQSVTEHTALLAELWSSFSAVAVDNPDAWNRDFASAETMRGSTTNTMLAFPYTKLHCSQWNVDQSAAFIVCSYERAIELGVGSDRFVFPRAIVESNYMAPLVRRAEMHRSPAVARVGASLADALQRPLDSVEVLDLYSCFPAAVRMQIEEFGITTEAHNALTITGGMTFGGGPLNNYTFQSIAKLCSQLRTQTGAVGIATAVSGILTKFGASAWSCSLPVDDIALIEVTDNVAAATALVDVDATFAGVGTIAGYTVEHDNGTPVQTIAIIDTPSGARSVATSSDTSIMKSCMLEEWIGRSVSVLGPTFTHET